MTDIEDIIPDLHIHTFKNVLNWYNANKSNYIVKTKNGSYIDFPSMKKFFTSSNFRKIVGSRTSKKDLIKVYKYYISTKKDFDKNIIYLLRKRDESGVLAFAVFTSPNPTDPTTGITQQFSCKHNCYYCPNEPGQPRSYIHDEPGVLRANRNDFDPIRQMNDRISSYVEWGQTGLKLEIKILGGTFTEYPIPYLEIFIRDIVYSANVFFDEHKRRPYSIETEIFLNSEADIRIVGLSCETRPDILLADDGNDWIKRFRKWGITRIQMGVQHTDNDILKKINRGHTVETSIKALRKLKNAGYKVDIHLMPDLPNASEEIDMLMLQTVYNTQLLQADGLKIYPTAVTPWTVIKKWKDSGKYKPYAQSNPEGFLNVMTYSMLGAKPWMRLDRVVRDIPGPHIEGGNKVTNLRQILNDRITKSGKSIMEIRYRECGRRHNNKYKLEDAEYITRKYKASGGLEYFISLESTDNKCIFGFIRLRISKNEVFDVLHRMGKVRELHIYGNVTKVGIHNTNIQHSGIGKTLLRMAEHISYSHNCVGTAVISGMGVTKYYQKQGYHEEDTYMIKRFIFTKQRVIIGLLIIEVLFLLYYHQLILM